MTTITAITLGIAVLSVAISVATFWFRKTSKLEIDAKDSVSKQDLKSLEDKVSKINVEISVITERLSNTIEQSGQISYKLDQIMYQVLDKDKNKK